MQKFENDSHGMKIFKQLWKQQNAGLSRTADRDKLKPLHFGPGGGLQHPKNIIDKHDLEKNPIYRMIQSRLTNNNPVDVDNLLNKSMLTRDVVEYIKSFERARNKAENLVSTLSAIKILGKEKAKDLRSADWGEDKDKRRSQMQALVNATQGFYDQAKHAMWNYSQGKKHTHVTSQHVIDFSNAVDQLKKRIDDLSNVSYKDADDIITQKFISKGWKGATGFKSSHHDDYKKGIIGVLYKQNANAGGKNWKNRNTQMMKYWTEIGKKA
jgi:hypothetical protein